MSSEGLRLNRAGERLSDAEAEWDAAIVAAAEAGLSAAEIAREIGVGHMRVYRRLKALGWSAESGWKRVG